MAPAPTSRRFLAISCFVFAPLLGTTCDNGPVPSELSWQTVFQHLPSGLLAVSGTGPQDVYIVGTDSGDGHGPMFAHYDGSTWRRRNTGQTGDLWWISAIPIGGAFYLSGENGMILRFDPQAGTFQRQDTPGDQTIFGVWGTGSSDIWAVGGVLGNQQFGGAIWHFDGVSWTAEDLSGLFPSGPPTLLKVWGRNSTEVYAVGAAGVILRYDGAGWSQIPNGTGGTPPLFSVFGDSQKVVAVGGFNAGVILEQTAGSFANRAAPGTIQMNGVYLAADGSGAAVGRELSVAFRTTTGWEVQDTPFGSDFDFHANWIDSEGGVWAVGGNLISDPINQGILVYYGTRTISTEMSGP
jgi:hypothetical protein